MQMELLAFKHLRRQIREKVPSKERKKGGKKEKEDGNQ